MHKPISIMKKILSPGILISALIANSGCSVVSPARRLGLEYYLVFPGCELAEQRSDEKILECTSKVKNMLRERMNNARLARTGGGFIQVVTAAISSLLTGTSGSSAVGAATILSGISAIIPEFSNIIEAKDKAEVYNRGLDAIGDAEAEYLQQIAAMQPEEEESTGNPSTGNPSAPNPSTGTESQQISANRLTSAGAQLYKAVGKAVRLVEKGLTGKLPTLQELQELSPKQLILSAMAVKELKTGKQNTVTVAVATGGPAVSATTNDATAATATLEDSGMTVVIEGVTPDKKATITVRNESGGSAMIRVNVVVPKPTPTPTSTPP